MLPPQSHNILSGVETPSSCDVLIGRGSIINGHPGNTMFRALIAQMKVANYLPVKRERSLIAKSIVSHIRSRNGRFLERDRSCKLWFDVGDKRAIEKTERSICDSAKAKKPRKMRMSPLNTIPDIITSEPEYFKTITPEPQLSAPKFTCNGADYDPLLIAVHRSETKESSLEYFKGLQTKKHLYRDEFHFLENIFGVLK